MANTIALRKQYSTLLDEIYKLASLTAVLDGPNELVKEGESPDSEQRAKKEAEVQAAFDEHGKPEK